MTDISSKIPVLQSLKEAGFNPIAVTTLLCEETFVFETTEECDKACKFVNPNRSEDGKSGVHYGYWYALRDGKYSFIDTYHSYKDQTGSYPEVVWLTDKYNNSIFEEK